MIPVSLQCFECSSTMGMNCNSMHPICFLCYTKGDLQKCSFCHAPRVNDTVFINFPLIHADHHSSYSCPLCSNFQGNHFELYKHITNECMFQCECKKFIIRKYAKEHYENGTCSIWKWCTICKSRVKQCKHMPCKTCGKVCDPEKPCQNEKVCCTECQQHVRRVDLVQHFLEHVEDSKLNIKILRELLQKERKHYHTMMTVIPTLYKNVYDEPLYDIQE